MSLEHVKSFCQRLSTDESFRTQINGAKNKLECNQFVKAAGYDFTQEEFEQYTAELLESQLDEKELNSFVELNINHMEAVLGGFAGVQNVQVYGVVRPKFRAQEL